MDKRIKWIISLGITLIVLIIPSAWIPVSCLSTVEQRILVIFILAVLFWVLEPIPVFATSIVIVVSELVRSRINVISYSNLPHRQ